MSISIFIILFYAVMYGVTMKIADLFDEHGLKWFRFSDLLFGLGSGFYGALLIFSDPVIANVVLAMNIAFLFRNRRDSWNHSLALAVIFMAFVFSQSVNPGVFVGFLVVFVVFGGAKDYMDDVLGRRKGILFFISELMLYYPIPTFVYCLVYGNWIVFFAFSVFIIAYKLTKRFGKRFGHS